MRLNVLLKGKEKRKMTSAMLLNIKVLSILDNNKMNFQFLTQVAIFLTEVTVLLYITWESTI